MTGPNQNLSRDEWLADFTDQVLAGEVDDLSAVGSDPEMRSLAETVLELKHTFPLEESNPASVKRIHNNVLEAWREESNRRGRWTRFFHPKWPTLFRRPQFGLLVAAAALAILIFTFPTLLEGNSVSGAAVTGLPLGWILILLGVLILGGIWLLRRK